MTVLRHNFSIDAGDMLELLQKQSARYRGKLDQAVASQDYVTAKDLVNRLEDLSKILEAAPVSGSPAHVVLDFTVEEPKSFGVPLGNQI